MRATSEDQLTVLHGLVVRLVVMYVLVRLREGSSPLIPIKYEKVLATRLHGQPKCSLWRLGNT
jgi:hypothetical protein